MTNHIKLYVMRYFILCFKKKHQLKKLYHASEQKLECQFNIIKIIKSLKDIKIFIKNKFLDDFTKFQIDHNKKNVIDLEDTSSSGTDRTNVIDYEDLSKIQKIEKTAPGENTKMLTGMLSKGQQK